MSAVLSPHEIEAATSLVEAGQQRGARELRIARIIAGRPKRIPGICIPLWIGTEDDEDKVARAPEGIVAELEDVFEPGESYKLLATTGSDVLKQATITSGEAPDVPGQGGDFGLAQVANATLRAFALAPKAAGDLAEVLASRESATLKSILKTNEDAYEIGWLKARLKFEPQEDPEVTAARWAAIEAMGTAAVTNPEIREGIGRLIGGVVGVAGATFANQRERWQRRREAEPSKPKD